jgi:hypothetical protein
LGFPGGLGGPIGGIGIGGGGFGPGNQNFVVEEITLTCRAFGAAGVGRAPVSSYTLS